MTDQAQILAIAGACGWKVSEHGWWSHPTLPDQGGAEPTAPDYLTSLDAMHEAEKAHSLSRCADYARHLYEVCRCENKMDNDICATARQRAEAFLRTLGLWVEGA